MPDLVSSRVRQQRAHRHEIPVAGLGDPIIEKRHIHALGRQRIRESENTGAYPLRSRANDSEGNAASRSTKRLLPWSIELSPFDRYAPPRSRAPLRSSANPHRPAERQSEEFLTPRSDNLAERLPGRKQSDPVLGGVVLPLRHRRVSPSNWPSTRRLAICASASPPRQPAAKPNLWPFSAHLNARRITRSRLGNHALSAWKQDTFRSI